MKNNENYTGRISPGDKIWASSPWTDLLKDRYNIASRFCEDKTVLDSCSGTGWGAVNYLAPRARSVTGIDILQDDINPDEHPANCSFMVMDARDIRLDKNSFDVVLSLDAIEHFTRQDSIKYLREMKKVCAGNGFVLGTTPLVADSSLVPVFLEWNKYHRHMYTRKDLHETLESVFPDVRIYEIYNVICPYFMFICGKSGTGISAETENTAGNIIAERKKEFKKGKLRGYLRWAKELFIRRKLMKAARFFFLAFRQVFPEYDRS